MEEQPQEQPQDEPAQGPDGQPKFFKSAHGMIAGATALVIALGGLATTWDKIFGDDKPATEKQAAASTAAPAEAPAETPSAAEAETPAQSNERPKIYTGELFADGKFEGGAMSLRHDGENWILIADQRYVYEPLASSNEDQLRAYNADYASYLRWPVDGGEVEESTNNKVSWSRYARVTASEPSPQR